MDGPKKRRFRFGLRTLLGVVFIVACLCMLGIRYYNGLPVSTKIEWLSRGMTAAEVEAILGRDEQFVAADVFVILSSRRRSRAYAECRGHRTRLQCDENLR